MKKMFTLCLMLLSTGIYFNANAQCSPPALTGSPGISPVWSCLPCAVQGQAYSEALYVENFTQVGPVVVTQLVIDSLGNIPAGLSYNFNPDNSFSTGETGCVNITGTTNDPVGDYKIGIYVTVSLSLGTFSGEAGQIVQNLIQAGILDTNTTSVPNFDFFFRVVANSGDCTIPDSCTASINELSNVFSELAAQPNPFSNKTEISWNSNSSGKYFAKVYDVVGKEVFNRELNVTAGTNRISFERGELAHGVYVFVLTDGRKSISNKLIIRD